jgi:nucleoside-diphosphate-sugar epimerase
MESDVDLLADEQRIRPEKSEVFRLCCDNQLLKKLTGFKPKYNLKAGLAKTCDWFSEPVNLAKYKAHLYNV